MAITPRELEKVVQVLLNELLGVSTLEQLISFKKLVEQRIAKYQRAPEPEHQVW